MAKSQLKYSLSILTTLTHHNKLMVATQRRLTRLAKKGADIQYRLPEHLTEEIFAEPKIVRQFSYLRKTQFGKCNTQVLVMQVGVRRTKPFRDEKTGEILNPIHGVVGKIREFPIYAMKKINHLHPVK